MRAVCWLALVGLAAAAPVLGDAGAPVADEVDDIAASEVYVCRKCGAIIARGVEYLPSSPTGKRLLSILKQPELGSDGKVLEFEQPVTKNKQRLALFRRSEPSVKPIGQASATESWFPGYSWRAAQCGHCGSHVGWQFDDIKLLTQQRMAAVGAAGRPGEPQAETAPRRSGRASLPLARAQRARKLDEESEKAVFEPLEGQCAELMQGYWTYEVCHGKEVRQFHVDMQAKAKAQQLRAQGKLTPPVPREPDWSLGRFDRAHTQQRLTPPAGVGARYFTSHFFKGGQKCDETGSGRRTEVQYMCCDGADNTIVSVEEPSQCKYRIQVCLQSACGAAAAGDTEAARAAAARRREADEAEAAQREEAARAAERMRAAAAARMAQGADGQPASFFAAAWDALAGDRGEALGWLAEAPAFTAPI